MKKRLLYSVWAWGFLSLFSVPLSSYESSSLSPKVSLPKVQDTAPEVFLGKGPLSQDQGILSQLAAISQNRAFRSRGTDIRIQEALDEIKAGIQNSWMNLTSKEQEESQAVLDFLVRASSSAWIGAFPLAAHHPQNYIAGIISGYRVALAEPFFETLGSINDGMPEILLRAGHRILFGKGEAVLRRAERLTNKILGQKQKSWKQALKLYLLELKHLNQIHQNLFRFEAEDRNSVWIAVGGYLMSSDWESIQSLQEWLSQSDPKRQASNRFRLEHRFLDELAGIYTYPDTVLRLKVKRERSFIRLMIEDIMHPHQNRIERLVRFDPEGKTSFPVHESLRRLPDLLEMREKERGKASLKPKRKGKESKVSKKSKVKATILEEGPFAEATIPLGAMASGKVKFTMKLGPAFPPEQDPLVQERNLYGQVLRRGVSVIRPELVFIKEAKGTLYIEPAIGEWWWVHDQKFALEYFDFVQDLTKIFRGLTVAHLDTSRMLDYALPHSIREGLLIWGMIDQLDQNPDDYAKWSNNLRGHPESRFVFEMPSAWFRSPEIRKTLLTMAREGFQVFSFVHREKNTILFEFSPQEILSAFEKARGIKSEKEQHSSSTLRAYMRQGRGAIEFKDIKGTDPSRIYLDLRNATGNLFIAKF